MPRKVYMCYGCSDNGRIVPVSFILVEWLGFRV